MVGGNYFGVIPYHSRFDSFSGALIQDEATVISGRKIGINFAQKAVRQLNKITIDDSTYVIVILNNAALEVYQLKKH